MHFFGHRFCEPYRGTAAKGCLDSRKGSWEVGIELWGLLAGDTSWKTEVFDIFFFLLRIKEKYGKVQA